MSWTLTRDLDAFLAAAGPLLRARPVANTVPLTIVEALRVDGDLYDDVVYGWWSDPAGQTGQAGQAGTAAGGGQGPVTGAMLHTQPFNVVLVEMPHAAVEPLARALDDSGRQLPGVGGEPSLARSFAAAWRARTGATATVHQEQRLYALHRLDPPDPMPEGEVRPAGPGDRDLLIRWVASFDEDAGLDGGDDDGHASFVDERLSHGGLTLWERHGEPVSLGGVTRPGAGIVRVGPIYTPPEHRRRGYGTAITAVMTRAAQDAGAAGVVLYTDLANPTSNSIYQAIGYRPVEDRLVLSFGSGQA